MTKYSLTIGGVLVSILGTVLIQVGFSEACTNEVVTMLPVLIGGVMSYVGRFRIGDVDALGRKL
jgi:hypothetical protein